MLDSKVDALLNVPVLDLLVDNHSNRALCDIVDNTCLSVIHLVWHTESSQYRLLLVSYVAQCAGGACRVLTPSESHRWP